MLVISFNKTLIAYSFLKDGRQQIESKSAQEMAAKEIHNISHILCTVLCQWDFL